MSKPRPEPGTEYACGILPNPEFRAASHREAVACLARSWGITETRAAALLDDPAAYAEAARTQPVSGAEARRALERRYVA